MAEHETGNFTEWTAGSKGGYSANAPDTSAVISTDVAHSGTHSVKLTNGAPAAQVNGAPPPCETALLWRQDDFPEEAYYSAWYYLRQAYQTTVDWRIMEFQAPGTGDGGTNGLLIDVDLRSLADRDLIIDIFDHRAAYLRFAHRRPRASCAHRTMVSDRSVLSQCWRRHGPLHALARRADQLRHPETVRAQQHNLLVTL